MTMHPPTSSGSGSLSLAKWVVAIKDYPLFLQIVLELVSVTGTNDNHRAATRWDLEANDSHLRKWESPC